MNILIRQIVGVRFRRIFAPFGSVFLLMVASGMFGFLLGRSYASWKNIEILFDVPASISSNILIVGQFRLNKKTNSFTDEHNPLCEDLDPDPTKFYCSISVPPGFDGMVFTVIRKDWRLVPRDQWEPFYPAPSGDEVDPIVLVNGKKTALTRQVEFNPVKPLIGIVSLE